MATQTNDIVIKARADVAEAVADLRRLQRNINTTGKKAYTQLARQQEVVYQSQQRLNKSLGKVPFAGYALSIMFFGAAMVNVFKQITTFGVRAFQDVMHSVDGSVTQFDLLQASLLYLGFVIGQALEPVIAWLIPIIDAVSEWISEHQRLAASILIVIGVLGSLLVIGGSLKLAIDGFTSAWGLLSAAASRAGLSMSVALGPVGLVIAGVLATALLLTKAFKETPEAVVPVKNAIGGVWTNIKSLGTELAQMIKALTGWTISWETIAWTAAWVFEGMAAGFNGTIAVIKLIVNAITGLIQALQSAYYAAKAFWQALLGGDASGAANNFSKAISKMDEAKTSMKELVQNAKEWGTSISRQGELLAMGPAGFQNEQLQKQFTERVTQNSRKIEASIEVRASPDTIDALQRMGYNNAEIANMISRQIANEIRATAG